MLQLEPVKGSHYQPILVMKLGTTIYYTYLLYLFRILKSDTVLGQVSKVISYALHHFCKFLKELNVP